MRSGSGDAQQDAVERLNAKLKEAKTVEEQLRRELTRANLERSSMESMVGGLGAGVVNWLGDQGGGACRVRRGVGITSLLYITTLLLQ